MNLFKKSQNDLAALVLRVGFGFFIVFGHGLGKFNMLFSGNIRFPALFGLPSSINLVLAVFAEFICGILVILGIRTKYTVLPLIATMLTAITMIHLKDPLFMAASKGGGAKEFAMIYLLGFVGIFFLGSGKYSIDSIFYKRKG